ncbi:roadblock/LC7 domain-containing protein [Streptomyces sp. NPDC088124]|uniref:roadblock/LC7 domain-containing protein n=1 Tax=Streptomyces sp. NPDC088124 TaxID=3154654 RepID=UPI00342F0E53
MSTTTGDLTFILDELVRTPHTLRAVLLTADGMRTAATNCDKDLGDTISAGVSGLQSLVRGAAPFADCEGPGNLTLVQYPQGGMILVMAAGQGSHLAVSASGEADVAEVSYAMETTVQRLGSHLDVAPRTESGV